MDLFENETLPKCVDKIEFLEINWIHRDNVYDNNSMYYRLLMIRKIDPNHFESLMNLGVVCGWLIAFFSLWGVLSNLFVLYVMGFVEKPMRINNVYIISLATADILVVLINGPISAIQLLWGDWLFHEWFGYAFSEFLCKLFHFTYTFAAGASGYTLTTISVERVLSIYFPIRMRPHRTVRNALKPIIFIYINHALTMFPTLFYSSVVETPSGCHRCYTGFYIHDFRIVSWMVILIGYVGPLLSISICNILILVKVISRSKKRNLSAAMKDTNHRSNMKTWIMILLIIFFYLICWFPFECLYIMEVCFQQGPKKVLKHILPPEYLILGYVLSFLNSCINPILYSLLSENFQNACKKIYLYRVLSVRMDSLTKLFKTSKSSNKSTVELANSA